MTPAPGRAARFDAVVLAGGRASRLGGVPKPTLVVDGTPLLDHALTAARDAERTVVVGPEQDHPDARGVLHAREDPPFGGPVAGLDAGLRALVRAAGTSGPAPWVLLLAVDVPRAGDAVPLLRRAVVRPAGGAPPDGAHLVRDGRAQWLVGLYRHDALRAALDALAAPDAAGGTGGPAGPGGLHGASVRRLVARLSCVEVPDPQGASADVDTWDDLRRLTVGVHDDVPQRATTCPGRN